MKRYIFYLLGIDCIFDLIMLLRYMLENIMGFVMFLNGIYFYRIDFMCVVDIGKKSI